MNNSVHCNHDYPLSILSRSNQTLIQKSSCTVRANHNWSYVNSLWTHQCDYWCNVSPTYVNVTSWSTVHSGTPNNVKVPILRESKRAISVLYLKLRDPTFFVYDSSCRTSVHKPALKVLVSSEALRDALMFSSRVCHLRKFSQIRFLVEMRYKEIIIKY